MAGSFFFDRAFFFGNFFFFFFFFPANSVTLSLFTAPPTHAAAVCHGNEWEVHGSQFAERLVLLLRGNRWTLRCLDR